MNDIVRLGDQVGLIGDVHGDDRFLHDAVVTLTPRGCNSLVQLGDFGMIWRGTRNGAGVLWMGSHLAPLPRSDLAAPASTPSAVWQGPRVSTGACGRPRGPRQGRRPPLPVRTAPRHLLGRYSFQLPDLPGGLRPLRAKSASDEAV